MHRASTTRAKYNRRIVWILGLLVLASIIWASQAVLSEIVRGDGRVATAKRTQVLQNLEGGIVKEILVNEGDVVTSGQIVATMDSTQFRSAYQELTEQRLALALKLERLEAEVDLEVGYSPSADLAREAPDVARSEADLYHARRQELADSISNFEQVLKLKLSEVDLLAPLVERSAVSKVDLVRLEQQVASAQQELANLRNSFEAERARQYAETLNEIKQVDAQIRAREDQLKRTDVRSPVDGIVNKISVNTIGGVVRSGDAILEILPLGERLRIEGRVDPRDIGFVYAGMPATVKLTAFDFAVYGSLTGSVVHVGADSIVDPNDREQKPYYEVFIEVDETSLTGPEGIVEVRPGMQAVIELQSGTRTVLQYLLKPLFRASEALTER
jgi:adhesin transport system membrane fusion protein